jgi:hypothetical protein
VAYVRGTVQQREVEASRRACDRSQAHQRYRHGRQREPGRWAHAGGPMVVQPQRHLISLRPRKGEGLARRGRLSERFRVLAIDTTGRCFPTDQPAGAGAAC